jgi:hypothetical protein
MDAKLKISGSQASEFLQAYIKQIGGIKGLEVIKCRINFDEAKREEIEALVAKYDVNVELMGD